MWKQATMFCTGEVLLMAEPDAYVCAASGLSGNCGSWFLALHLGSLQHRKTGVAEHALLSQVVQKLCNLSASQCSCTPCTCAVPPWWRNTWKPIQMWAFLRPALHWNLRMNEGVAQVSSLHGYEMKKPYFWPCVMSLVPTTYPHYHARHSEGPISVQAGRACLSATHSLPSIPVQVTENVKSTQQHKAKENAGFIPWGLLFARIANNVENIKVKILPEA